MQNVLLNYVPAILFLLPQTPVIKQITHSSGPRNWILDTPQAQALAQGSERAKPP